MERMKEMRMDFCFVCFCNSSPSSFSFSLSFGVCVCASSALSFLFLLVCVCLVDRQICSPVHSSFLFLLIERAKEMRRIIILSVCFLVFCCFFSLSFGAVFWQICSPFATPAFVVNGKSERSEEYHCVCFFRFLFCCSFECYGCGDDDDGGGGGDSRVPKHPGGSLIHVKAGQDCTQLFESYHPLYVRSPALQPFYCLGFVFCGFFF